MNKSESRLERTVRKPRARIKFFGLVRVGLYGLVVCLAISAVAARSAWADLKESALVLGRELAGFGDLLGQSHRLRLNGEPVFVSSALTEQPVQTVLGRFDKLCREHAGGLVEEFEKLPSSVQGEVSQKYAGSAAVGILREGNDQEGVVACLSQEGKEGTRGLLRRLDEFAATGDLAAIGNLRYAYAKRTPSGRTHVLVVWTEGSFRVRNLVPVDGAEPPGQDPPQVPRPQGALRLLSAEVEGAPHGLYLYEVPRKSEDVLRGYEESLPKQGWTAIPVVAAKQPDSLAFQRPGADLLVVAQAKGDRTYISLVESVSR